MFCNRCIKQFLLMSQYYKIDVCSIILRTFAASIFLIHDHISTTTTTMFFLTIFLYTGLWQGRGAEKRCRVLARAQIYIYIYVYIYIKIQSVCLSVCSCLFAGLTTARINLIFSMHTFIWSDCAIGYIRNNKKKTIKLVRFFFL